MLRLLDELLRKILVGRVPTIAALDQVGFQPPDEDWVNHVKGNKSALNLYLVEFKENRRLRSNERERVRRGSYVVDRPVPTRLDCQYVLTAWSAATDIAVEPTLEEHDLLYAAAEALVRRSPLTASRVYAAGSPELAAWGRYGNDELPTWVLPADGFARMSDFWTTMGKGARWKPAIHLHVTVPLDLEEEVRGFPVRTTLTDHGLIRAPALERIAQIGGVAFGPPVAGVRPPLPGVVVQLTTPAGDRLQETRTDAAGRFVFSRLAQTAYRIECHAPGLGTKARAVSVPSPSGEYDVSFP